MSQFDFGTINPDTKDGTTLASDLGSWRDALNTVHGGAARPAYVQAGMLWRKEVSGTLWELTLYDGTTDVVIANVNPSTGVFSPPNDSVGGTAIQANAVNTGNIANLAVTAEKLANLAITAGKIADGGVIRSKIDASAFASGNEIRAATVGDAIISPLDLGIAHDPINLGPGPVIAPDFGGGVHFVIGQNQNFTIANPLNQRDGQTGLFLMFASSGGPHTISYGPHFRSAAGQFIDTLENILLMPYFTEFPGIVYVP